ncbi:MAG: hypothetical protein ACK5RT_20195 [Dolichospermum sp.]
MKLSSPPLVIIYRSQESLNISFWHIFRNLFKCIPLPYIANYVTPMQLAIASPIEALNHLQAIYQFLQTA